MLFALNLVTLLMQIQSAFIFPLCPKVVICFKFSNFAYANTVVSNFKNLYRLLLFALNLVTLLMQIQLKNTRLTFGSVVICFKFSNFAYANTVSCIHKYNYNELLFALNLVTLLMQIQCFLKFFK